MSASFVAVVLLISGQPPMPAGKGGVTVEEVSRNFAKYRDRAVTVVGIASGKLTEGPSAFRLVVRDAGGFSSPAEPKPGVLTFVLPKDQKDRLTRGWVPTEEYRVRLGATILPDKGDPRFWFAAVKTIEVQGTVAPGQQPGGGPPEPSPGSPPAPGLPVPEPSRSPPNPGAPRPESPAPLPSGRPGPENSSEAPAPTTVVIVEGVGLNPNDALKDALRNAVRQVVGAVVDAETLVKDDQVISDKVLTFSPGLVKKYDEVKTQEAGGLVRKTIRATVERTDVVAKLRAANVTVKGVDGKGLFAEAVTGMEREKDGRKAEGGYVIVPPSRIDIPLHEGRSYTWEVRPWELSQGDAPVWSLGSLQHRSGTSSSPATANPWVVRPDKQDLSSHPGAPFGQRRDTLCSLIGRHLDRGDSPATIFALAELWAERCTRRSRTGRNM